MGVRGPREKASRTCSMFASLLCSRPVQPFLNMQPSLVSSRYHSLIEFLQGASFPNLVRCRLCIIVTHWCHQTRSNSTVLAEWPFCLPSECIASRWQEGETLIFQFIYVKVLVTYIWHLIFYGKPTVGIEIETLGNKTWCVSLLTLFAVLLFANYSEI
jgi:hypothetical protein